MTARPKQIVIDKSAFEGIRLDDLSGFAKDHVLVLPNTLLYECATAGKASPLRLIDRFKKLASMGSYVCTSVEAMIRCEARNGLPYGNVAAKCGEYGIYMDGEPLQDRCIRYDEFVVQLMTWAGGYHDRLSKRDPSLLAAVRTGNASSAVRPDRLRYWLELVDSQNMHKWSLALFEGMTAFPDKFCLSDAWVAWNFLRLCGAVFFLEQAFLTHKGGPPGTATLEHNLQDIFYVTLLCRADGLLTRDWELIHPLARAAFPEKDVFSSLEEVPESYRRDWT